MLMLYGTLFGALLFGGVYLLCKGRKAKSSNAVLLAFIGLLLGMMASVIICGNISDRLQSKYDLSKNHVYAGGDKLITLQDGGMNIEGNYYVTLGVEQGEDLVYVFYTGKYSGSSILARETYPYKAAVVREVAGAEPTINYYDPTFDSSIMDHLYWQSSGTKMVEFVVPPGSFLNQVKPN
jgi:ABC-type transport system involved in multi-copper enzyme maturation permease subunit